MEGHVATCWIDDWIKAKEEEGLEFWQIMDEELRALLLAFFHYYAALYPFASDKNAVDLDRKAFEKHIAVPLAMYQSNQQREIYQLGGNASG